MFAHTTRVAPEKQFHRLPVAVPFRGGQGEDMATKALAYKEQLLHPKWQKRRLEIMGRDEFTCQSCYDKGSTLHVHHKHYIKGRMAWEYGDDELVTLCRECHENAHDEGLELKTLWAALRVDGPHSTRDAMALVAGWSQSDRDVDTELHRKCSPFSFVCGQLADLLEDTVSCRVDILFRLQAAYFCADGGTRLQGLLKFTDFLEAKGDA